MPEEDEHDFSHDYRTGRPVIGSPEALERVFACYRTGVILGPLDSWSKPYVISSEISRLITARAQPLRLPPRSRIYAYVWEHPSSPPAEMDCAGLPKFSGRPSLGGPG
jgi:hypothetical protein